jgi:ATPase subunit of ABC transporter with duplicated ATPase domains
VASAAASRLCQLLLRQPDLLLLDEPTNHLDAETTAWLEKHLRAYPGAVMIITHDRYFLDNVTGWILELDRGRGIPYEGNYTKYLEAKAKRLQAGRPRGRCPPEGHRPRARVDPVQPEGPPDQVQGAYQGL